MLNAEDVLVQLKEFVTTELLDGEGQDLDQDTPLLQWGIVNSLSLIRLVGFAESRFAVKIPASELVPKNFQTLSALTSLIGSLSAAGDQQAG